MAGSSCKQLIHSENHEGKNCFQLAVVGGHVEVSTAQIVSTSIREVSMTFTTNSTDKLDLIMLFSCLLTRYIE